MKMEFEGYIDKCAQPLEERIIIIFRKEAEMFVEDPKKYKIIIEELPDENRD